MRPRVILNDEHSSLELIDSMPSLIHDEEPVYITDELGIWDQAVIQAARVTHLEGSKGKEKDVALIQYLMRNHHTSPLEQVQIKWRINAPLVTYWQWIRHRTFTYQSINSQSGRYSEFDESAVHLPVDWRIQSKTNHQGSAGLLQDDDLSTEFSEIVQEHYNDCYKLYHRLLGAGIAKEQARLVLPGFAVYYMWICSVNLHNLLAFLKLRLADDAQEEIYLYARGMFETAFRYAPIVMSFWMNMELGIVYNYKMHRGWGVELSDTMGKTHNFQRFLKTLR